NGAAVTCVAAVGAQGQRSVQDLHAEAAGKGNRPALVIASPESVDVEAAGNGIDGQLAVGSIERNVPTISVQNSSYLNPGRVIDLNATGAVVRDGNSAAISAQ